MIGYWVTPEGRHTIDDYRAHRGREIADRIQVGHYDTATSPLALGHGPQIFAALDECTPAARELAVAIWDAHAQVAPSAARLNDPRRVRLRFELLSTLHAQGLNSFRVYEADAVDAVDRFPVFVRLKDRHVGVMTDLLSNRGELAAALRALRLRGARLRDLMIVEFCDTANATRQYRKYAAFKVGPVILPCHLFVSSVWCVKAADNQPDAATLQEQRAFLESNPHHDWLARVFAIAGIDYGRIDYGVANGVPQAWEINMNPTLGRGTGGPKPTTLSEHLQRQREEDRADFHRRLRVAFLALEREPEDAVRTVTLDARLVEAVRRERDSRLRRQRRLEWLRWVYHHPRFGVPIRTVYAKLLPRR